MVALAIFWPLNAGQLAGCRNRTDSAYSELTAETCGISQPSSCGDHPQHPDPRHRVCRNGRPHPLGASLLCAWEQDTKPWAYCRAHDSGHKRGDSLTPSTDPAMGSLLSAPMPQIVGGVLLFLGDQLLHRRIRRYCSSANLAPAWTARGHHGCLDVWNFRERVVRHCNAADRKRGPVVGGRPILAESEHSTDQLAATTWVYLNSVRNRELSRRCCYGKTKLDSWSDAVSGKQASRAGPLRKVILHACANILSHFCPSRVYVQAPRR